MFVYGILVWKVIKFHRFTHRGRLGFGCAPPIRPPLLYVPNLMQLQHDTESPSSSQHPAGDLTDTATAWPPKNEGGTRVPCSCRGEPYRNAAMAAALGCGRGVPPMPSPTSAPLSTLTGPLPGPHRPLAATARPRSPGEGFRAGVAGVSPTSSLFP